jgi:4-carboxymuconolactone decarboxylase
MKDDRSDLPKPYAQFMQKYPSVGEKYEALGDVIHKGGPLTERERALVKMAVSGSHLYHSAFKSHIRKAKMAGVTREEMEHVALLMLPTVGFPTMMGMLSMISEQLASEEDSQK